MARFNLDFSRKYDVPTPLQLRTRITAGRVEVRGHEGSTAAVEVRLDIRASSREEAEREAERFAQGIAFDGTTLTIESPPSQGDRWPWNGLSVEYDIRVPRQTQAEVRLANGYLSIQDVAGPVEADLANGPLKLLGVTSQVAAHVVNGPLDARDCAADLEVSVVNGPLRVTRTRGPLSVAVTNGPIHIEDIDLGVQANVQNGTISYKGAVGGDFEFETNIGSIVLDLPKDSRFELDAEADHGTVHSDFEVNEGTSTPGQAHRIHLRTHHGNIHLSDERRPARGGFWRSLTPVGPPFPPGR